MPPSIAPGPSLDAYIQQFPHAIRDLTSEARSIFREALPNAIERLYPGWELIGYRVPAGSSTRYVGFIAPKHDAVILGFEHGTYLVERFPFLAGTGRQVRQVELAPGCTEPSRSELVAAVRAAAQVARAARAERLAVALGL